MSQIISIPAHYETAFNSNWIEIMAQQSNHRLQGHYLTTTVDGNQKRFSQHGAQSYLPRQKTARAERTEPSDVPTFFRWVRPRPYDKVTWIDEFDKDLLGQLPSPESPTAIDHAKAFNRQKDLILINALQGTNYTGQTGTTATTLPAGQQVAVNISGSNAGLTLLKLTQAAYILNANDIPDNDRALIYASKEEQNLLQNVDQVNNVLYNEIRALLEGKVTHFMGFKFIRTELLSKSGNIRTCLAFQKSALMLGIGEDVSTKIDILPGQSHAIQVRSKMLLDATRMEETAVVSIACDESI